MIEILNKLDQLHLDNLGKEWVQAIFDSDFLEYGELPTDFESGLDNIELNSVILELIESIDDWLNTEVYTSEEKSWAKLSQEVEYEKLLGIIAYYIDYGNKNVLNEEYRNNALLASRLYYKLISIPGYKAYHIYHSQLFVHSLGCLNFPKTMCDNEDNYFNTRELTCEVNKVLKVLQNFMVDLNTVIKILQLQPCDINFEEILNSLVEIIGGAVINKLSIDKMELANIITRIYEVIDILIGNENGIPSPDAIKLLFKCLLPKLVAASADNRSSNHLVKASYVTYLTLILKKYGKLALTGYLILLQHLCYTVDGMERGEVRNSRMSLVISLMSPLPKKSYKEIIKWILKLSITSKVAHRQIAVEILHKLLNNDPEEPKPSETPSLHQNQKEPDSTIQGADATNNMNNNGDEIAISNKMEQNTNDAFENRAINEVGRSPVTETEHELAEEEMEGILNNRPHTAPHRAIIRAIFTRVHDVSSALRMRALLILTECIDSTHSPIQDAIKELNGSGDVPQLMAMATRCASDERAVVRRAAVNLVHRLLNNIQHHTSGDLSILVGLCRDASIIVRTAAITSISELVMQQPNDTLLDAFLTGPMHQLSDPETKIQEQVVSQIQQIIFERINNYSASEEADSLPWLFLAAIIRHNMRRHLQKACILLFKSSQCINHRLVDKISTHMGSGDDARDLQCLLLLTSVARHIEYSDLGFLLEYYYKFDYTEKEDVRLLAFVLEMLTLWSRWLTLVDREKLRTHLIGRLASASNPVDDGCRTACATLAAHLDPSNLQWATELMQIELQHFHLDSYNNRNVSSVCWSPLIYPQLSSATFHTEVNSFLINELTTLSNTERRAISDGRLEDCMRAADLSLVAPVHPSVDLLQQLLAPLAKLIPDTDDKTLGMCVAGAGRICVRSRAAAVTAAPRFAALLRNHDAPLPPRLNALHALTDICVRYTCIVEPLLDAVCECVNVDTTPLLRRAAARALTRLLLAGYLRLRTPLYFRYCALIADEDHDVREPAEYYVSICLTADAIYHHFVDCVLHYNHNGENISFDARQLIYDVMLQRLSMVQKLNVQCRLAQEVLQHAADITDEGNGELPAPLYNALLDTITLLCGPRMRLPKKPQNTGEIADIDDLQERVTTNIVSHKMKRTVAEVLVPAVLRLYERMRARGGQLATYLVRIANDLLVDYRQEIEELIENNEELVQRIQQFQETIGLEPSFGNTRNLVTSSSPHDPETPRPVRKRHARTQDTDSQRKRALKL